MTFERVEAPPRPVKRKRGTSMTRGSLQLEAKATVKLEAFWGSSAFDTRTRRRVQGDLLPAPHHRLLPIAYLLPASDRAGSPICRRYTPSQFRQRAVSRRR